MRSRMGSMLLGASPRVMLAVSGMLLLSGCLQLATSWVQMNSKTQCDSGSSSSSSSRVQFPSPQVLSKADDSFTWLGDDYPNAASIDFGDPVSLTIEDSRHYALNNPESEAEYFSIYPGEYLGFVHLGPNKRFFGLSMYHQIHCLASLRKAILGITHDHRKKRQDGMGTGMGMDEAEIGHTHHCLNYLRQTILCNADVTLEPEVPEGSQDVGEGLGVTHVCRDWGKVYDYVKRNEAEWLMWRNGTGN